MFKAHPDQPDKNQRPLLASDSSCIVLRDINKFFGDKHILKEINLEIPYGQIYGLLGPSGSGKTTMVKIMVGILAATSGEAYVLGEKMPQLELMQKIGYMAQADALYPSLSAAENLEFFAAIYGMDKSETKRRIAEVMAMVNLSDDINKAVQDYSGGMKRRLSLAMSILHNPPVLVLDEPTVGIDPILRKSIWEEFNELTKMGITILVTTHVMDEAEKCHHLAMLRDGRLTAKGTAQELMERIGASSLEEAFIYYGGHQDES